VSSSAAQAKMLAIAAVLWVQRVYGFPPSLATETRTSADPGVAAPKPGEPPRSRDETISSVKRLLRECIALGLSHLSDSARDRYATLSVSALGVNLPRLSLGLNELADEVAMLLKRTAQADERRLLLIMARTYALAEAVCSTNGDPRADLVGSRRTRYEEVQALELTGVSAYYWRTGSGYFGLTVLFWDVENKEWLSWSDSRSVIHPAGFNPVSAFDAEGPWPGAQSPNVISRSRFRLSKARKNGKGRLSSSSQSQAIVLGPSGAESLDFGDRLFTRWRDLLEYARRTFPVGLEDSGPLDNIAVLQPTAWGKKNFDQINQMFSWPVIDASGMPLTLEIAFDETTKTMIRALENIKPSPWPACRVVVRLVRSSTKLSLYPLTFLDPGCAESGIFHLGFDTAEKKGRRIVEVLQSLISSAGQGASTATPAAPEFDEERSLSDEDSESEVYQLYLGGSALERRLGALEDRLGTLAESGSGCATALNLGWTQVSARELRDCGLIVLARFVQGIGKTPEHLEEDVLRCTYICHLHRQAVGRLAL